MVLRLAGGDRASLSACLAYSNLVALTRSDLSPVDGDMFTLVWDPDLLIASNESPSDYTAPTLPRMVDKVELRHIKEVRSCLSSLARCR